MRYKVNMCSMVWKLEEHPEHVAILVPKAGDSICLTQKLGSGQDDNQLRAHLR